MTQQAVKAMKPKSLIMPGQISSADIQELQELKQKALKKTVPAKAEFMPPTMEELKKQRMLDNLISDDMAPLIPYFEDKKVTDIAIVDSGEIIVTKFGEGRVFTGTVLPPYIIERIIKAASTLAGRTLDPYTDFPILEATVPKYNARITGFLPPAVIRPEIQIRKPPVSIYTLEQYVKNSQMTEEQYELLVSTIKQRGNILVTGSTGSGKTTCTNAIIKKMTEFTPDDNFYIVEDTAELQCTARMKTMLCVPKSSARKAVEESLRFSPDRIIFGEVRTGEVMAELLDAWKTGHSGNVTTLHANNARAALLRIKGWMTARGDSDGAEHISDMIQLVIHLSKTPDGIRMDEITQITEETDRFMSGK